ncbi:MAG: sigma-70 family RNA polymerase sigma factor [Myxococcota bacterium]
MNVTTLKRLGPDTVASAIAGDLDAIERVAHTKVTQLYRWCARLGGPRVDAEEAAHDVVMLFVRRHASIRDPARLDAWLFSACRRVVANHRRRAWLRRWLPGRVPEGSTAGDGVDHQQTVYLVLDAMSDRDREVLTLCYLDEYSMAEAGQILGIPEGTVKSRLSVARDRFRTRCLDAIGGAP